MNGLLSSWIHTYIYESFHHIDMNLNKLPEAENVAVFGFKERVLIVKHSECVTRQRKERQQCHDCDGFFCAAGGKKIVLFSFSTSDKFS